VVEADGLRAACKAMGAKDIGVLSFESGADFATLTVGDSTRRLPICSLGYPNWRQVVPTGELAAEPCGFNPGYLSDIAVAAKRLGIRSVRVEHFGSLSAAQFTGEFEGGNFRAVLMPIRLA